MPRTIYINLPVADVAASTAFYEAIGFTRNEAFSNAQGSAMAWSDTISFMLLDHAFFASLAVPGTVIAGAGTTEALFALSCDDRAGVDAIVAAAVAAGGKGDVNEAHEESFMYGRSFLDLDGHAFGPMWMDAAAMTAAMPACDAPVAV